MALPAIETILATPKLSTLSSDKTSRLRSAPLPPAPPRNCRQVLSDGQQQECAAHVAFARLKGKYKTNKSKDYNSEGHSSNKSENSAKKYPTLTLAVQQRRHSAPAFAAFSEAFARMKRTGSKIAGTGEEHRQNRGRSMTTKKDKSLNSASTDPAPEVMDRLNALFPTPPGSLQKASRFRQLKEQQQQKQMPSLSLTGGYTKIAQFSSSSSTGKLSALGSSPKVGSSGRLSPFARTPSGGRLVSSSMRRVRSGNNLF